MLRQRIYGHLLLALLTIGLGLRADGRWGPVALAGSTKAVVRAVSGAFSNQAALLTLPVQVEQVTGLGAATIWVIYDPTHLAVQACQSYMGLCNPQADQNQDGVADAVLFNLVALEGVNATQPVDLAQITWQQLGPPGATPARLDLIIETFTDGAAAPIAVESVPGEVQLSAQPPADPQQFAYLPMIVK